MNQYLNEVAGWLRERPESSCQSAAIGLAQCARRATDLPLSTHEPPQELQYLESSAGASPLGGLATGLVDLHRSVYWYTPGAGNILYRRSAYCRIVGPDGAIKEDDFFFGGFLLAPDTVYPLHSHAALETYVILSGHARWWNDERGYRNRTPGEVIVHESWQPHAMRTGHEPLLTLWIWQGEISFDAYRYEPAGFCADGTAL